MTKTWIYTLAICLLPLCLQAQKELQLEVYFAFNQSSLSSTAKQTLDSLTDHLTSVKVTQIDLTGHCDQVGDAAINQRISEQRVAAVRSYLEAGGFHTIGQTKGWGKQKIKYPAAKAGAANNNNRRVEIRMTLAENKPKPIEVVHEGIDPAVTGSVSASEQSDAEGELLIDAGKIEVGDVVVLKDVQFRPGQAVIIPQSEIALYDLLEVLETNPDMEILIEGHVCCNPDYELSEARAKTVRDFLIKNDIPRKRLQTEGFANTKPIGDENTGEGRQANRRVEIRITKK